MPSPSPSADDSAVYSERARREFGYSPFLPMLVLVVAGLAWPAFQCYQLINEGKGLAIIHTNQTRQFEDAGKLRNSLETIARETAILAEKGNPGAKMVVGELAKRGVTINPNASSGSLEKAPK